MRLLWYSQRHPEQKTKRPVETLPEGHVAPGVLALAAACRYARRTDQTLG